MSVIEVGGAQYVITTLSQTYVTRLGPSYRTVGIQQRESDVSVNRYVHPAFPLGLGWQRIKRDSGRGVGGMLDSTCWTALGPVGPGKLQEVQTHADPAEHFVKAINFRGDLWGLFEEAYDGAEITNVVCRKFGATSDDWTGGSNALTPSTNAKGSRGWDMVAHKSLLFVLTSNQDAGTGSEVRYTIVSSPDVAAWTDKSLAGWPEGGDYLTTTITRRNNFDDDMGRLLSFGNALLAAVYRHPDSTNGDGLIEVLSTTDSGTNWGSNVTIPSGDGPKALVDWYDRSGTRNPVLVIAEGIYSIDTSANTFELIYALDGDSNNGRWATVGNDGALYVGLGSGSILRLSITDTNTLEVMNIGPPGDGLVTARQGHVNYMLNTPSEWLMVAYGGHAASKNASIFMIDTSVVLTDPETGKKFMPWHHMYQHDTANVDIIALGYSTEDDATPRLHFAVEGAAASVLYHIEEPFVNPLQSTTVKYQATSILRIPDDDLGDPQDNAVILQALVDADDLTAGSGGAGGATDEFITLRYGINGTSDTTTTLGDFLSGTLTQSFGSGAGIAARRIGINLLFDRGSTNTNRPLLQEFELQGQKLYVDKKAWEFTIDIEATARGDMKPDKVADTAIQETIIAALEAVAESSTLVTFTVGGMTQARVRVPPGSAPRFDLKVVDSNNVAAGYRTGYASFRLEEAI